LEIVNLVVHQDYRKREIGSLLLERLESRSEWQKIFVHVRESNLDAQLFLKRKGFLATNIKHRYYEDYMVGKVVFEDAYQFEKQR
jgi:ribosomal protein S18 acetylase RimI-like enzyme